MRRVKVSIMMCEMDTGGFVTGISRHGDFSEKEFHERKFDELVREIQLIEGCEWSYNFKWYNVG